MEDRQEQVSQKDNTVVPVTNKQGHPEVIAAIPCFNEERFIGTVVLKAKNYVDLVMVIDDGSTDNTSMVAEQAGATVIKLDSNQGKGVAVSIAFDQAREIGCSALVLLDGDGQHEPADIPCVLKPVLDSEADMVVGSRFLDIKGNMPRHRSWGQRPLTFLTNLGSQVKLSDSQSGFRAFSQKAIKALSFAEKGLSVESEMQFLANEADLRVVEVPVGVQYHEKAKRSPVAHGIGVLNTIVGLTSRRFPLLFFGLPGVIMLAGGIADGMWLLEQYSSTGFFYIGHAMITVLLCIVGALSLFTGLILHNIRSYFRRG